MKIRVALIWLLFFAVFASTVGLDAFDSSDYGGDEPHYLLIAKSLVDDGDIDLLDDYEAREYEDFYPYELDQHGQLTDGRLHEPHGVGFPLLIAPAFAIGGERGVEFFLAAIAALALALAYPLALRVVPDPYALGATLAVGLSPPFLAYGSAVYPELTAAALLTGAALLALRLEERPTRTSAVACFALLAPLPWLGAKFLIPGAVIGYFAWRRLTAVRRPILAVLALELAAFSVAFWVGVNQGLYDGLTPYSADSAGETGTDADFPFGYLERSYRLVALWIDREYGLLRFAPVFAMGFVGLWLLYRGKRERLARVIPAHARAESTALLCAAVLGAQVLVAAFLAPTMFGFWFPPRHLLASLPLAIPLVAWGIRQAPRVGALLGAIGIAASVWIYVAVRSGSADLVTDRPDAPWGPLEDVLPLFDEGRPLPYAIAAAVACALAALAFFESRHWRQTAGTTREKYSG